MNRAHVHRAAATVMAWLRQTQIHHGFTMTTRVSKATAALVIIDQLNAVEAAWSMAGPRQAFVEIPFAVFTNEAGRAGACVTSHAIHTLSSIQAARLPGARLGGTVIIIHFTLESMCSRWAGTGKAVDEVETRSSVEAGPRMAFINIILTVHPLEAWFA